MFDIQAGQGLHEGKILAHTPLISITVGVDQWLGFRVRHGASALGIEVVADIVCFSVQFLQPLPNGIMTDLNEVCVDPIDLSLSARKSDIQYFEEG